MEECVWNMSQQNEIPKEQYLSISELFEQKDGEILNLYSPFKNAYILQQIKILCKENVSKHKIDSFFQKLREDFEQAIQEAEIKAKEQLIKNQNEQHKLFQELSKIAEIDKLKYLLVSNSQELNLFLQEKWKNAEFNKQVIKQVMNNMKQSSIIFNQESKQKEINSLLKSLQQINLFDKLKFQKEGINLIKSTYLASGDLTIKKTDENNLQLINKQHLKKHIWISILRFSAQPQQKIYNQIKLLTTCIQQWFLLFGLVLDKSKNSQWCYNLKLSYHNLNESYGIGKYIKGPNITQNQRKNKKEEFEVRIFLDEKILKVASLPDYSSILELENKNNLLPENEYRFYVYIQQVGDMIEITEVMESNEFEGNIFRYSLIEL